MAEYSKSHYSPRLKRIIVLGYTNSVTITHSRIVSKNFSLISFNFSQHIHSNGHALTVGCLISMRKIMHETYSLHKDGGFANELNQL